MFITVKTRRRKMRKNTHLPRKGEGYLDCIGHLFVSINVGDLSIRNDYFPQCVGLLITTLWPHLKNKDYWTTNTTTLFKPGTIFSNLF